MGGGSVGSSGTGDFREIEARAMERLRRISSDSTRTLFACEKDDVANLQSDLAAYGLDKDKRVGISPHGDPVALADEIARATLVVAYTRDAKSTKFIDEVVESAYRQKKPGLHIRGVPGAKIPTKVSAYRWRSMTWVEFMALLS